MKNPKNEKEIRDLIEIQKLNMEACQTVIDRTKNEDQSVNSTYIPAGLTLLAISVSIGYTTKSMFFIFAGAFVALLCLGYTAYYHYSSSKKVANLYDDIIEYLIKLEKLYQNLEKFY